MKDEMGADRRVIQPFAFCLRPSVCTLPSAEASVFLSARRFCRRASLRPSIIFVIRSSFREDTMSRGWMPRRCVPMKDVALLR